MQRSERVLFCKEGGGILAVFPSLKWDNVNLTCYAHVGQHSAICPDYFKGLEVVENPKDYLELQNELLSLGYKLNVLNGKPNTILRNVLKTK